MGPGRDIGNGCSLCGAATFGGLIAIAVMTLGIAKIVMGTIYLHDCDIERMIPIFLIVSGCMSLLVGYFAKQRNEKKRGKTTNAQCIGVFGLFSIAWLTTGSIWVFPNWRKLHVNPCNPDVTNCITCNTDLLNFAAAVTIIDWVFMWLFIVSIYWICIRACCESLKLTKKKSDDSIRIEKTKDYLFPAETGSENDIKDGCSLCGAATFCGLITVTMMTLGIAKIVMGTIYLHDCDINRFLPMFLILGGFLVLICGYLVRQGVENYHETILFAQNICQLGLWSSLSLLISGSFFVFSNWRKPYDNPCKPDDKSCITCNTDLLTFALAVTIIDGVLIGLFHISFFCIWIRICCNKKSDDRNTFVTAMNHVLHAKMGSSKDWCYLLSYETFCWCCRIITFYQGTLGIPKIVLGTIYLHYCDIEQMIPIFLIVSGFISLMLLSPDLHQYTENNETRTLGQKIGSFLQLFSIPWLIAGSFLVFPNWRKLQNNPCKPDDKSCVTCNTEILTIATATTIIDWVIIGLFFISFLLCGFRPRSKPLKRTQNKSIYRIWIVKTKEHLSPAKIYTGKDIKDDTPPFCCKLIAIAVTILGLAKIVMGTIYLQDCDIERMIPIFLIVGGCIILILFAFAEGDFDENWENCTIFQVIISLMAFFSIAWLIAGSVWVFPNWRKLHDNPCKPDDKSCITCNTGLLTFAAAVIIIYWVMVGMNLVCSFCDSNSDRIDETKEHVSPAKIGSGKHSKDDTKPPSRYESLLASAVTILYIAKIVLGAMYLHDCDIERMIPIFMIVGGCMPFMLCCLAMHGDENNTIILAIFKFGLLFCTAWLIAGSFWVFPNWMMLHDNPCRPDDKSCITCNTNLLTFAAAVTIIDWVFVGMFIVFLFYISNRLSKIINI